MIGLVLLCLVPVFVVIAATAGFWFRRFKFVRVLREKAPLVDDHTINIPRGLNTVRQIRRHGQCGSKIVLTHCLVRMAEDVERRISRGVLFGIVITLIVQTVIVVSSISRQARSQSTNDFWQALAAVSDAMIDAYGTPVYGAVLALLYVAVAVHFLEEQVYKYRDAYDL